jgi:hypothetical protein
MGYLPLNSNGWKYLDNKKPGILGASQDEKMENDPQKNS